MGLILFGSTVVETCAITPLFEVFRDHIDSAHADGETCLVIGLFIIVSKYDALTLAVTALTKFGEQHKGCAKRIICLSDGEDTKSSMVIFSSL